MAAIWLLQDSPIFWFAATTPPPPPPTVSVGGYTSYDLAMTLPFVSSPVLPEVEAQIRRGDRRYIEGRP